MKQVLSSLTRLTVLLIATGLLLFAQTSASYNGTDITTQGTWTGQYGADGYQIANGAASIPGYASVSVVGYSNYTYTWDNPTTDPRALQSSSGSTSRIASAFVGSSFSFAVNITDGQIHKVSLYLLDYEFSSVTETISILNANTGAVLDTKSYPAFSSGEYASWNISGNVVIQITQTAANHALVSGIFFDPAATSPQPTPPTSSASFLQADTATQGNWTNVYGAGGYQIANGATSMPQYATFSVAGNWTYTWESPSTDPRSLQSSPGSTSRIASAFVTNNSLVFTVNITDGQIHQVALYLLDFDSSSRAETITIYNPVTGAVLDTESYSAFSGGEYVSWNIGGSVVIQVTETGDNDAVVSGIFFGPAAASPTGPPPPMSTIPGSAIYAPASGSTGNVANFTTDYYFSGGGTDNFQSSSQPPAVDTSETNTDGYQNVYQNDRYGNFSYILPNLTPGEYYTLNLHFAEIQFTSAAQRQFNVSVNNTPYLKNFDIVADAGAANRATVKSYRVTPDSTGKILVSFTPGAASNPKLSGLELFAPLTVSSGTASASATVVSQIAAGSSVAVGSFSADAAYAGGTAATYSSGPAIDLSGVNNPAPSAVYQAERSGSNFSYTLPNLAAGQVYTVRLHFAENVYSAPAQRQFNVFINNAQVLTNFDIFAAAGAASRAIVRAFAAVPNSSGQIVINFATGTAGSPKVSGIELVTGVRISSSGAGASYWEADQYYNGGGVLSQSGVFIDTSRTANPAPQPVYENNRYGYATYTIPNLNPGTAYQLNLHFAEITASAAGQRQFNVDVNGTRRLTNFDIFAEAGGSSRAVVAPLSVTASSAGQIIVHLTAGAAQAPSISGLELVQAGNSATQVTISGTVTAGTSPLAGALLTLSGSQSGTSTTGSNGSYSFSVPSGGTYTVTASLANYAFATPSQSLYNVISSIGNVNFSGTSGGGLGPGPSSNPLSPTAPLKEYIYFNGQIIAIEHAH